MDRHGEIASVHVHQILTVPWMNIATLPAKAASHLPLAITLSNALTSVAATTDAAKVQFAKTPALPEHTATQRAVDVRMVVRQIMTVWRISIVIRQAGNVKPSRAITNKIALTSVVATMDVAPEQDVKTSVFPELLAIQAVAHVSLTIAARDRIFS